MTEPSERLLELLAARAVTGLEGDEAVELESLLQIHPEWDDDSFGLAAAALDEALGGPTEPLPAHLRERLVASSASLLANASSSIGKVPTSEATATQAAATTPPTGARVHELTPRADPAARSGPASWVGWLVAAAALVLAALSFFTSPQTTSPAASAAEGRLELLAAAPDLLVLPWTATDDTAAAGAGGDVVWSASGQSGFMRIRGLAANDPSQYQYQLWVFDAERDDRFPVDGGVFDIVDEEVVVPIDVRVPVAEAALFAITVERPGGVVVSSRERIVLLAQAEAGN